MLLIGSSSSLSLFLGAFSAASSVADHYPPGIHWAANIQPLSWLLSLSLKSANPSKYNLKFKWTKSVTINNCNWQRVSYLNLASFIFERPARRLTKFPVREWIASDSKRELLVVNNMQSSEDYRRSLQLIAPVDRYRCAIDCRPSNGRLEFLLKQMFPKWTLNYLPKSNDCDLLLLFPNCILSEPFQLPDFIPTLVQTLV